MAIAVYKKPDESFESMLGRFKKKFKDSKLTKDFFESQYYTKPSEVRKEKLRLSKLRCRQRIDDF